MSSRYVLAAAVLLAAVLAAFLLATGGSLSFVGSELTGVRSELAKETASNVTAAAFRGDGEALSDFFGRTLTTAEIIQLNNAVPPSLGGDRDKYEMTLSDDQNPSGSSVTVSLAGPAGGPVLLVDLEWDAEAMGWRPVDLRSAGQ